MAELTELRDGERRRRARSPSSPRTRRACSPRVRELGLDRRRTCAWPRGLKALAGFGAQRFAVIDVGTNSVKFHVGERRADGAWRTIADRAEVTRLGEGLDEAGRLGAEPIERTVDAIAAWSTRRAATAPRRSRRSGPPACGSRRTARSSSTPSRRAAASRIEVISGEEEARLAYLAATAGARARPRLARRLRHRRRQLAVHVRRRRARRRAVQRQRRRRALHRALRARRRRLRDTLAEALAAIAADLDALDGRPAPGRGRRHGRRGHEPRRREARPRDLRPDVVQGTVLDRGEIDRQIELYRAAPPSERRAIVGLQPNRAEVILAGACIVRTVLDEAGRGRRSRSATAACGTGCSPKRFALRPPAPR